jgi:hypothetical protein
MKYAKFLITLIIVSLPMMMSTAASARGYHHHRHHGHHSHFSVGFLFGPGFYYPPYYAYPPVVVQPAPVYYIEQNRAEQGYWYYCNETKTYYPYVQQCVSPWARVTPQSPPPSQ